MILKLVILLVEKSRDDASLSSRAANNLIFSACQAERELANLLVKKAHRDDEGEKWLRLFFVPKLSHASSFCRY